MGFSTNVTISNDFWHEIKADPEAFVDGITVAMNYGTNSPLADVLDTERGDDDRMWERHYRMTPQGVTVHKALHNDEPQIIVSTYGSEAVAAHEIPYAIQRGWLKLNQYNEKHAESIAHELERVAKHIRRAIKEEQA